MKHIPPCIAFAFAAFLAFTTTTEAATTLQLSANNAVDGDIQTLTLSLDKSATADVYMLLSHPKHGLRSLKADGEFTAAGRIVPRLSKAELSPGNSELATWRITGLEPGTWTWSVLLVKPGTSLSNVANRLGLATATFELSPHEGPLFAELAEGRDGGPRGAVPKKAGRAFHDAFEPGLAASAEAVPLSSPGPAPDLLPSTARYRKPSSTADKSTSPPPSSRFLRERKSGMISGFSIEAERKDLEADIKRDIVERPLGVRGKKIADRKLEGAELAEAKKAIEAAQALSAGASDDNKDFAKFLNFLRNNNSPSVMCQDIAQRRFITVLDSKGVHVSNADIAIRKGDNLLFAGRSYANGQTLFSPSAVPELSAGRHTLEIEVAKGLVTRSWTVEINIAQDEKLANKFNPESMPQQPMPIDVMPLPGCGLKPMARVAKAERDAAVKMPAATTATTESALRALKAKPVAIDAKAFDWLEDFKGDFSAIPSLPAERKVVSAEGDWILRLPGTLPAEAPKLDLVFQIDTTGSMRDEIRAVQATLQSVATRIASMDPAPRVRWGLVLYGDRGDVYVVRRYAFTPDVNELHQWINNMQMTSGGDTPESALEALHASVNEMAWDSGDAIRLVFLIADARPHLDYKRPYTYVDKMKEAVAKGIKIIPTAASGLDKTGEYIFRQWAQATMSQFLFITYGAGGAGGKAGESPHEVNQPKKKNNLDDLIVKTVADELESWKTPTFYHSKEPKIEQPRMK